MTWYLSRFALCLAALAVAGCGGDANEKGNSSPKVYSKQSVEVETPPPNPEDAKRMKEAMNSAAKGRAMP